MRALPRAVAVLVTATMTATLAGILGAAPASADESFPTYGSGVRVRADATTASGVVGSLEPAESIAVDCQKAGETVTVGNASSSWWAHVPAKGGYVTVVYVDIPESKLLGIPECSGGGGGDEPAGDVTYADLAAMFPGKVADEATVEAGLGSLNAAMTDAGITTAARKAAFLATLANESTFRYNAVQAGGSSYTGRGYIQLTGSANYGSAGSYFGIDLLGDPALAASLDYSAPIARWYWTVARDINPLADALDMGGVDAAIGYAIDPAEDVERCDDFKSALTHFTGSVPAGINCVRPTLTGRAAAGTQQLTREQFAPQMRRLLSAAGG